MPKNRSTLIDLLGELPWWVSVIASASSYVIMVYALPNVQTDNPMIDMVFNAFAIPAPFITGMILLVAPFAFFNSRRKANQLDKQRNINTVRDLHWRNFEELVAEAFRRQGYRVTEGGYGADGGIDLVLRKGNEVILVQCKQWKTQKVGVNVVREMFGVLTASNASRVFIICSGKFTPQAIDFASSKPISLLGADELFSLVQSVQPQTKLEIDKPVVCPRCGSELIERQAKRGANAGNSFLGCSSFPRCRYTK